MKQITTIIGIASLTSLSIPVFSFAAATVDAANQLIHTKPVVLSQPIHVAASEAKTDDESAPQQAIQGNEMQDERMEFEEEASRREFGDDSDREEFKEQEIRREFGGRTNFLEPAPKVENHDH